MNKAENEFLQKLKNKTSINDDDFKDLINCFKIEKISLYEYYIRECKCFTSYRKLEYLINILKLDVNKEKLSNELYNENNIYYAFQQDIITNVLVFFLEQCLISIDNNYKLNISGFYKLIGSYLNIDEIVKNEK